MKKFLITRLPLIIASLTLLIVTCFLRYNLYLNSTQLSQEFLNQNSNELYSIDSFKISSRLNAFSRALNWVCIQGEVNSAIFFNMRRGDCETSLLQQKVEIFIPEANNIKISLTLKLPKDIELLFGLFLLLQVALIFSLIFATKKTEEERLQRELKFLQFSRKMFHDIRSPLASLNFIAEGISFEQSSEEQIFKRSIKRINDIASSLLISTQKPMIHLPAFLDFYPFIEETIADKKNEYVGKNLSIFFETSTSAKAYFEPIELRRILSNIINNSIEAANGEVVIQIKAQVENQNYILDIIDNGAGIPMKILAKLGSEEISTKLKGNGLGIIEAANSLKEWNGNLEILETSSKGTTLRLTFQAKDETRKYYLIDDDDLVRITWEAKARKNGVFLQTFNSHADFFAVKDNIPKDSLIYIDSELGNIRGEKIALALHEECFLNIYITSGHSPAMFSEYSFLKGIICKSPPF